MKATGAAVWAIAVVVADAAGARDARRAPILEAMSYAVPVAVSDIPVFHEVAGGAALYFNKDDPASIASAIKDVITNESLQAQLIEKSVAQLKNFSWDDVADEVMRSFRGILDSKK